MRQCVTKQKAWQAVWPLKGERRREEKGRCQVIAVRNGGGEEENGGWEGAEGTISEGGVIGRLRGGGMCQEGGKRCHEEEKDTE